MTAFAFTMTLISDWPSMNGGDWQESRKGRGKGLCGGGGRGEAGLKEKICAANRKKTHVVTYSAHVVKFKCCFTVELLQQLLM